MPSTHAKIETFHLLSRVSSLNIFFVHDIFILVLFLERAAQRGKHLACTPSSRGDQTRYVDQKLLEKDITYSPTSRDAMYVIITYVQVYCAGPLETLDSSKVTITGGTFDSNKALELGGALHATKTSVITIKGGNFKNNTG